MKREPRGPADGSSVPGPSAPALASPPARTHATRLRVRYADTDAMGVVHHANYLAFFEAARVELLREAGLDYRSLEGRGLAAAVVEATCRYHLPARFDDLLLIRTRVAELKRASFTFEYQVLREADGALLASGRTLHACLDRQTFRPIAIPDDVRRALSSYA